MTQLYVKRGENGKLVAIAKEALPGFEVYIKTATEPDATLLEFFLLLTQEETEAASLLLSDFTLIRVLEDLVSLLIDKQVIRLTDLPADAQAKLLRRKKVREQLTAISPLSSQSEDDDTIKL